MSISKLELLKKIYGKIIIPKGVYEEIEQGKYKPYYTDLSLIDWIEIKTIKDSKPDLVIIDEKLGRNYAKHFDLKLTGTIGILLKSKELKLITTIKPFILAMTENGIWLNEKLINKILEIANE